MIGCQYKCIAGTQNGYLTDKLHPQSVVGMIILILFRMKTILSDANYRGEPEGNFASHIFKVNAICHSPRCAEI